MTESESLMKMEQDFSEEVAKKLPEMDELAMKVIIYVEHRNRQGFFCRSSYDLALGKIA
jgi:Cdc6-like AAA superfamily ATPase